jgi:hypothetical protein
MSIDPAPDNYCIRIEYRESPKKVTPLVYTKVSLSGDTKDLATTICNLTDVLQKARPQLDNLGLIVIEGQLPDNYISTRVCQHSISYYLATFPECPIFELHPIKKAKILGSPTGLKGKQLKKWLTNIAKLMLGYREESVSLDIINTYMKDDDMGDVVCQLEALLTYLGIPNTFSEMKSLGLISPEFSVAPVKKRGSKASKQPNSDTKLFQLMNGFQSMNMSSEVPNTYTNGSSVQYTNGSSVQYTNGSSVQYTSPAFQETKQKSTSRTSKSKKKMDDSDDEDEYAHIANDFDDLDEKEEELSDSDEQIISNNGPVFIIEE